MYIIVSLKRKDFVCTKNYDVIYNFIVRNQKVKIKTIHYPGVLKVLRKQTFLTEFYVATRDAKRLFDLMEIIVKGRPNHVAYVSSLGLQEEYKTYNHTQKELETRRYENKDT